MNVDAHAISAALNTALEDIADVQLAPDRLHVDGLPLYVNAVLRAITTAPRIRERSVVRLSVTPSTKCSCSGSPPILAKGKTTIESRGGADFSGAGPAGFHMGGAPIQSNRPGSARDILEFGRAEIVDREIKPSLDLPIRVLGKTDRAGRANALDPRGDVDAVAHQVAVGLLDDVAQMNANAELDASLGRQAGVALDHAGLHFDRATHRVDNAAELDDGAVAVALDDAPMMRGYCGIDQVAAQPPQPRQGSVFVRSRESAVTDNIGDQDRSDLPRFRHGAFSRVPSTMAQGLSGAAWPLAGATQLDRAHLRADLRTAVLSLLDPSDAVGNGRYLAQSRPFIDRAVRPLWVENRSSGFRF